MKLRKTKSQSMMKQIAISMLIVLFVQLCIFWGSLINNGIFHEINGNAVDIFSERVINRKNYVNNQMLQYWGNIPEQASSINNAILRTLVSYDKTPKDLTITSTLTKNILKNTSEQLIYILRKNRVTGAFVVFNGDNAPTQITGDPRAGVYIRDLDPFTDLVNNSDLLVDRGSSVVTKALNLSMNSYWTPNFEFKDSLPIENYEFYYKPFQAVIAHPNLRYEDYGYWSAPFKMDENGGELIAYTLPLIGNDGEPYGVIGVEIAVEHFKKFIPHSELSDENTGGYTIGVQDNPIKEFRKVLINGPAFKQNYSSCEELLFTETKRFKKIYTVVGKENADVEYYNTIQYLDLYNADTPFEGERWALVGSIQRKEVLGFSNSVAAMVFMSTIVAWVISIVVVIIVSKVVTNPIQKLGNQLRDTDPMKKIKLNRLNIIEIDQLSLAVEQLNESVYETSSKMSKILEMASVAVGAFEYNKDKNIVFYSRNFFNIFGLEEPYNEHGYMAGVIFDQKMSVLSPFINKEYSVKDHFVYNVTEFHQNNAWVRLKIVEDESYIFGIVEDVTTEIIDRQRLEHDRDYDLLTNLLNRRAFYETMDKLFENIDQIKNAAMLVVDLNNLKTINEKYGHDYGDKYIFNMAKSLKEFSVKNIVLARMSGDEFYLFFYGYKKEEELKYDLEYLVRKIKGVKFSLPDDDNYFIQASFGCCLYRNSNKQYDKLIICAEFALDYAKVKEEKGIQYFAEREFETEEVRK